LNYTPIVIALILIIVLNVGYSYKLFIATIYGDLYEGISSEISKLINPQKLRNPSLEFQEIGELLQTQPDIENSYIMTSHVGYAYHSNSKFLYTDFRAGEPSDSLIDFVERKNWSDYDLYVSNIISYPRDKHNLLNPIPDYLIYQPVSNNIESQWYQKSIPYADVSILADPYNEEFPSNFELLYLSKSGNTFVYRIHYD
jgi:hypothetical protein